MARQKCRDCSRCTESAMRGCLLAFIRLDMLSRLFIWPFRKMCPTCGHPLSYHSRDSAGRFHD